MNKLTVVLGSVSAVLVVCLIVAGYFAYKSLLDENAKLKNEIVSFKLITKNLARSSTEWATKSDLEKSLKTLMNKKDLRLLKDDLESLKSKLVAVGSTIGSVKRKIAKLEKSDSEGEEKQPVKICKETGDPIDIHGYTKKTQAKKIKDRNSAPVVDVEFDASKDKPWSYEVHGRKYRIITAVGKKDSGQMTFHHQLYYSVPSYDPNKLYPIEILSSEYKQRKLGSKFFWLNPCLDVNFVVGGAIYKFTNGFGRYDNTLSIGADVGLSLSSYGETKIDSWIRMFRLGLGYNSERRSGSLSFTPVLFNIGKSLPLLTNLYLSPQVAIDTGGGILLNMGIGPQF
jgi:hypothetical protein